MYVENELKKELVAINNFLLELVAALPAGVIVIDSEGSVIVANQVALNLLGKQEIKVREIIDKPIFPIITEINILEKEIQECLRQSRSKMFIPELRITKKDGDVFLAIIGKPIIQGMLIFLEDITHVRKIEEAERMEADFISLASHQLRTPLTSIQWVVERFSKKEKLTMKGKEYLDDINESVKRLTEMVDSLLNLSHIEAGRDGITIESVNVTALIKSFLSEIVPLQDKKELKIIFKEYPPELQTQTDKNVLRNIVQSIISNAIEYTGVGGKIIVSLQINVDTFILKVKDTGIGIPKAERLHVFEKFMRASNAKLYKSDGTGIGLYIAEQATYRLGGKIWFDTEENKGSTFYVELPLSQKLQTL
jgi:two-component system sensor histidine kinase VicK